MLVAVTREIIVCCMVAVARDLIDMLIALLQAAYPATNYFYDSNAPVNLGASPPPSPFRVGLSLLPLCQNTIYDNNRLFN